LIAALDNEQFAQREEAGAALTKLGSVAEPALRKALAAKPTPEARRRIERLLERLQGTPPERLRPLRALEILEGIGNLASRQIVEEIGREAQEEWLKHECQSVLGRLPSNESPGARR
jgi:hypothetical protein